MSSGTLAFFAVLILAGQVKAQPEDLKPIQLTVYPAKPPTPALKYQLLPHRRDQTTGNAAERYRKVAELIKAQPVTLSLSERLMEWRQLPPRDLPRQEVAKTLKDYEQVIDELVGAAFCERCDWDLGAKLRQSDKGLLVDHIPVREGVSLLDLAVRAAIADQKPQEAIRMLQAMFAASKHLAEHCIMSGYLTGLVLAREATERVQEFVQLSHVPNMYWALANLPSPLIDMRSSLEAERMGVDVLLPRVRETMTQPNPTPMSEAELLTVRKKLLDYRAVRQKRLEADIGITLDAVKLYPKARAALVSSGFSQEHIDKLPSFQIVLCFALLEHDRMHDEVAKWSNLPFWEGRVACRKVEAEFAKERVPLDILIGYEGQFSIFAPVLAKVYQNRAHLDRKLAALRIIEALRLYAANHEGKLPAALADIKEVPIPIDPITGKGFEYKLVDGKARLYGPPPPGEEARPHNTIYYELTIKRKAGD